MTNPPAVPEDPAHPFLHFALATAVAILIAYGSLYPFVFRDAGTLSADISHFLGSWQEPPRSRGDFVANLLLYIPLGLVMTLAFAQGMPRVAAAIVAGFCGAALSLFIELAQFFDAGRVSAFSDFILNAVGTLFGIVIALVAGARLVKTSWPAGSGPAFARLLLLAWLGWRLYPYAPTISLAKYWHSIRPLLFAPGPAPLEIFRLGVFWLSVFFLLQTAFQPKKGFWLFLPAALFYFAAKILIVGQSLSLGEILGALAALVLSPLVTPRYGRFAFLTASSRACRAVSSVLSSRRLIGRGPPNLCRK